MSFVLRADFGKSTLVYGDIFVDNYSNRVTVTDDLTLNDSDGVSQKYIPIGVVPHSGNIYGKKSSGHYTCDLKQTNGKWIRTNDDKTATVLSESDVTKSGYIVLYKRKQLVNKKEEVVQDLQKIYNRNSMK